MNRARAWQVLTLGLALLAFALPPGPARAIDYVSTTGRLSDAAFYRLVSCGALPGAACQGPSVAWPSEQRAALGVSIAGRDPGFPPALADSVARALDRAVAQVNGAGAGLRLRLLPPASPAPIRFYLRDLPSGTRITGTGLDGLDGTRMQIARFHLRWDGRNRLRSGIILIGRDLAPRDAASVVLEELVQATGLRFDIRNPAYRGRSIFDEDSNLVRRVSGQDAVALRLHYPEPLP